MVDWLLDTSFVMAFWWSTVLGDIGLLYGGSAADIWQCVLATYCNSENC